MKRIVLKLLLITVLFNSCSKDSVENTPEPNIYIVGQKYDWNSLKQTAMYWKNGVEIPLTNGIYNSVANSVFVSNNDVFIAGSEQDNGTFSAKFWKNGLSYTLDTNGMANAIYVVGYDIYVCGYKNTTNGNSKAAYWKNGVPTYLSDGTTFAEATDIVVVNNDVYVCGNVSNLGTQSNYARYWKNNVVVNLNDGTTNEKVKKIRVTSNNDVIVGGMQNGYNKVKYWKNGVSYSVDNTSGQLWSMSVVNNDVFLTGNESYKAIVWKNNVKQELTDGSSFAIAQAIGFFSGYTYVAGYQDQSIKLWKNGVSKVIATNNVSTEVLDAYDMCVTN